MHDSPESFQEALKSAIRKTRKNTLPNTELGKLPPQAIDLEEAVLGAVMLERDALYEIMDIISAESFYKQEHQEIYSAAIELFEKSQPIDLLTVSNHLRSKGKIEMVGGSYYISQLTDKVNSAANIKFHAHIIQERYILREMIRISGEIQTRAYDPQTDVFDLLDDSEQALFNISEGNFKNQDQKMSALISAAIKQIEEMKDKKQGLTGVGSGFKGIDEVTSGWQKSDLVIIAARPGMGKTAFVLSVARNAAIDFGVPVAIFSLEMSNIQLVNRLISAEAQIPGEKIRNGNLEEYELHQLHSRINKLSEAKIFIDDTPALNIFDLRAKARRLKDRHQIGLIIIDYLQLMSGGSEGKGGGAGNREQEISKISRALKGLAKDLNVPVLALSQLSRAVETRGGTKKPMLSDLRESGSIEQDADMVFFLYRGEYYGFQVNEEDQTPLNGIGEAIIAKNRHGSLGSVKMRFIKEFAKFEDIDHFQVYRSDESESPSDSGYIKRSSSLNEEEHETPPF